MRLFPPELVIGDYEGFTPEKDLFARKNFGEGLGNLFGRVEDPMVAILDAPWGSGKTTFVKMWCGHMRNRSFPVIYFDAFKNDYTEDAFLALAGEVIALANELGSIDAEAKKGFLIKAQKVAAAAVKGGIKKGFSKLIGEEGVEEVVAATAEEGASCVLDSLDSYLLEKLEGRKKERDAFMEFGRALELLSGELSKAMQARASVERNGEGAEGATVAQRPLVFVIDELDRCNPPFALDLLEKVKHFFSVSHVHFLLVTHMEQLENSVRFAYGMGEQAGTYLQKFYHAVLSFPPEANDFGVTNIEKYLDTLFTSLPVADTNAKYSNDIKKVIQKYAIRNNITLRSLERITTRLGIHLASTRKNDFSFMPIASVLCIMKVIDPALYKQAQSKTLALNEVSDFMAFDDLDTFDTWLKAWWGFCIGDEKYYADNKEKMEHLRNSFYHISDRSGIVPTTCKLLDMISFAAS